VTICPTELASTLGATQAFALCAVGPKQSAFQRDFLPLCGIMRGRETL